MPELNLEGRVAVCGSRHNEDHSTTLDERHTTVPSSVDLPFFEYRGIGSSKADLMCFNCHFHQSAHHPNKICKESCRHCKDFKPHGPWEFDVYYCGHAGWD